MLCNRRGVLEYLTYVVLNDSDSGALNDTLLQAVLRMNGAVCIIHVIHSVDETPVSALYSNNIYHDASVLTTSQPISIGSHQHSQLQLAG